MDHAVSPSVSCFCCFALLVVFTTFFGVGVVKFPPKFIISNTPDSLLYSVCHQIVKIFLFKSLLNCFISNKIILGHIPSISLLKLKYLHSLWVL